MNDLQITPTMRRKLILWIAEGVVGGLIIQTKGKNVLHFLIASSDNPRGIVGRVAEIKIEDRKGANLQHGNGIRIRCKIDTSETIGGLSGPSAGWEFDNCRLVDPYTDHVFDVGLDLEKWGLK